MSTVTHKLAPCRRLEVPPWALQPDLMRALIVRHVESRAGFRHPRPGTDAERLARAQSAIDASIPRRAAILKRLCEQVIALRKSEPVDLKRIRSLEMQIECADSAIISSKNVALMVAGVIYRYYRLGESSVGVAHALGIKPPAVRQTLWRLRREWARMHNPAPPKPPKPPRQPKPPRPATPRRILDVTLAATLLADGLTLQATAARVGYDQTTVRRTLKRAGLWVARRRGQIDVKRAASLRASGLTYREINKELGCKHVVTSLRNAGLWTRKNRPYQTPLESATAAIARADATLARLERQPS